MYDIEGKYKKLMTIADNKIPKLNRHDKQEKYRSFCAMVWDANVIIRNCKEDEREMLHIKILCEKKAADRWKRVYELMSFLHS